MHRRSRDGQRQRRTNALLDLGLETLTGGRLAFLNVTAHVLDQADALFPPGQVVNADSSGCFLVGLCSLLDAVITFEAGAWDRATVTRP